MTDLEELRATRLKRERRRRRQRRKRCLCMAIVLAVIATVTTVAIRAASTSEDEQAANQPVGDVGVIPISEVVPTGTGGEQAVFAFTAEAGATEAVGPEPTEGQTPEEPEKPGTDEEVVRALLEQGYISDEIPLSYEEQIYLRAACEESGTPFALALAVIQKETQFQNVMGDNGRSFGLMQIQQKWHEERMERLGVTDLMDPFSNFRVGCDILSELLGKYELKEALTAYNSGHAGHNAYSDAVAGYYEDWLEVLKWQ